MYIIFYINIIHIKIYRIYKNFFIIIFIYIILFIFFIFILIEIGQVYILLDLVFFIAEHG